MTDEVEITIKLQLRGVSVTLTLAEAEALRVRLNELLGTDDAKPISEPFAIPVGGTKKLPSKMTYTSGEPMWVDFGIIEKHT